MMLEFGTDVQTLMAVMAAVVLAAANAYLGLFAGLTIATAIPAAVVSMGVLRPEAIRMVTQRSVAEAIIPTVDNTRTVGLVTLPGAFVGVLLGGGSALQAGASQVLVLLGILAGQAVTIVVAHRFMMQGRLLPSDLKEKLHD